MNKTIGLTGLVLAAALGAGCATSSKTMYDFSGKIDSNQVEYTRKYYTNYKYGENVNHAFLRIQFSDHTRVTIWDYYIDGIVDKVDYDEPGKSRLQFFYGKGVLDDMMVQMCQNTLEKYKKEMTNQKKRQAEEKLSKIKENLKIE